MDNPPGPTESHYDRAAATPPVVVTEPARAHDSTRPRRHSSLRSGSRPIPPPTSYLREPRPRPTPSIRIRRFPSSDSVPQLARPTQQNAQFNEDVFQGNRRRSSSEPQRPLWATASAGAPSAGPEIMPCLDEEPGSPAVQSPPATQSVPAPQTLAPPIPPVGRLRRASASAVNAWGNLRRGSQSRAQAPNEYGSDVIDLLDVVDPEVSTLSTLTNVQNSLFIPDLGTFLNRRPTYTLTRRPSDVEEGGTLSSDESSEVEPEAAEGEGEEMKERPGVNRTPTLSTITSRMTDSHYAVLPHGVSLDGWSAGDKAVLDDHVRHMLHSKRSKFKRAMKGFGQYIRQPLGFFVTVYATLITLFGLAWVLFLIGWINVGGRQLYVINVIDNVLVALFALIGDGLAPFRAVDTYHMIFIAHYHHLTWRLRRERALPKLEDQNDLPSARPTEVDVEEQPTNFTVLSPKQQARLTHHQNKFSKSHTFYKPHETETHHAFPLRLLVAVVVLLDCHSMFQIALGTCTWSISYHVRPFALTTVILCCSITCNITAGVLISVGDRRTRKKDVVERMFRQQLTEHAMKKLEKRKRKEQQRNEALEEPGAEQPQFQVVSDDDIVAGVPQGAEQKEIVH